MTSLEIILWIVAGLLMSEVLYICWTRYCKKHKDDKEYISSFIFGGEHWICRKICSLLIIVVFIFLQLGIVSNFGDLTGIHYENLLYEIIIIGLLIIFFLGNKLINTKIMEKK